MLLGCGASGASPQSEAEVRLGLGGVSTTRLRASGVNGARRVGPLKFEAEREALSGEAIRAGLGELTRELGDDHLGGELVLKPLDDRGAGDVRADVEAERVSVMRTVGL